MGREIRMVPADWDHPKDEQGRYIPLFDKEYHVAAREWIDGLLAWEKDGPSPSAVAIDCRYYWEWNGAPPEPPEDGGTYRARSWTPEEATHYQLYETTTEGTPISPVFDNLDDLCRYAAEHCTTFADFKATTAEWKAMLAKGFVYHREGQVIFT